MLIISSSNIFKLFKFIYKIINGITSLANVSASRCSEISTAIALIIVAFIFWCLYCSKDKYQNIKNNYNYDVCSRIYGMLVDLITVRIDATHELTF